jgi:hypothetical protein
MQEFVPIMNDVCKNAIGPIPSNGLMVFGSTMNAMAEPLSEPCFNSHFSEGDPGVWYTVHGTGNKFTALFDYVDDFESGLSIYLFNGSCEALSCLMEYNSSSFDSSSFPFLTWQTIPDKDYFFLY